MSEMVFRKTIHGMHRKLLRRGKILSDKGMTLVHNGAEHKKMPDFKRALVTPDGAVWYCDDSESEIGGFSEEHEDGHTSMVCSDVTEGGDKIISVQSNPYNKAEGNVHTEEFDIDRWEKWVTYADLNCDPVPEPMTEADRRFVEFKLDCTLGRIQEIQAEYTSRGQ